MSVLESLLLLIKLLFLWTELGIMVALQYAMPVIVLVCAVFLLVGVLFGIVLLGGRILRVGKGE